MRDSAEAKSGENGEEVGVKGVWVTIVELMTSGMERARQVKSK